MKLSPVFCSSVLLFLIGGSLASCAALPCFQTENESWYTFQNEDQRQRKIIGNIKLTGVFVSRSGGWDSVQGEIKGLAPLLLWRHGLYAVSRLDKADYAADIRLYEREYISQWRTKRSLSLDVRIWAVPPGTNDDFSFDEELPLAAGRVSGSGAISFSSSQTLSRMLSLAIKDAVKRLDKKEQANDE